ncbi:MAG TPA: hypothetical protein VFA91_07930 [Candidatus Polarisedimenticolia bacterium]|nr:hypothetical protein [Candidatus Polarisedimenticolia bacterium]
MRLAHALDRIDAALSRLEVTATQRVQGAEADQGRLTSELRELRGKNATLQAEARNVAARLDSVIERLKIVAES